MGKKIGLYARLSRLLWCRRKGHTWGRSKTTTSLYVTGDGDRQVREDTMLCAVCHRMEVHQAQVTFALDHLPPIPPDESAEAEFEATRAKLAEEYADGRE